MTEARRGSYVRRSRRIPSRSRRCERSHSCSEHGCSVQTALPRILDSTAAIRNLSRQRRAGTSGTYLVGSASLKDAATRESGRKSERSNSSAFARDVSQMPAVGLETRAESSLAVGQCDSASTSSAHAPAPDASSSPLAFFHLLERLKTTPRTGWTRLNLADAQPAARAESISDHMYRMAVLALSCADSSLDIGRCVQLAIVHDLAEAVVGDIAPLQGISAAEKQRLEAVRTRDQARLTEQDGIEHMLTLLGPDTPAAERIRSLWDEYEARSTPEARFVRRRLFAHADCTGQGSRSLRAGAAGCRVRRCAKTWLNLLRERRFCACDPSRAMTMLTRAGRGVTGLAPFLDSTQPHIEHACVKRWSRALYVHGTLASLPRRRETSRLRSTRLRTR